MPNVRPILLVAVLLSALCSGSARADVIGDWNAVLLELIRVTRAAPPVAARDMAILNTAMFDVVNAATGLTYQPYRYDGPPIRGASVEAAAAGAAAAVLGALYPALSTSDAYLGKRVRGLLQKVTGSQPTPATSEGLALGRRQAAAILAARQDDGSELRPPSYYGGEAPGLWRPTAPGYAPGLLPAWPRVLTWAIPAADSFRPAGPPPLTAKAWIDAFNEVRMLGSAFSKARTEEQTEIALFWADDDGTQTPAGHWLSIAATLAADRGLSLLQSARLSALVSITLADAAIVGWDAKYSFATWRPESAIQSASGAGVPGLVEDREWVPLLITPAFPEYTSGHSTFSGAAAELLKLFFGTDHVSFTAVTDAPQLTVARRRYTTFSHAAEEAGLSRIYGGIHFSFSDVDGRSSGRKVADFVFTHVLQPAAEAGVLPRGKS